MPGGSARSSGASGEADAHDRYGGPMGAGMKTFAIEASPQSLLARARQQTAITDIVDTAIEERLSRFTASLNAEAQLSESGAAAMEQRLMRLLRNRLRMLRDLRAHPEILEPPLPRPIFMTGAPRTGSTKLHKMLAAGGDFRFIRGWQGLNPALRSGVRGEDPAERIAESDAYAQWLDVHAPQARIVHEFSSQEPDEDSLLFEHCLHAPYLAAFVFMPSYAMWYVQQDPRENLAFVKQGLQYLRWQFHDGDTTPWILKCPAYLGSEPLLAELFPDASFITTNRDPMSTMSSAASLCSSYQRAYSDVNRDAVLGPMMVHGFGMAMQAHLAGRDRHPQIAMLDIGYTELTRDALTAVERIYAHVGMPLSPQARAAMLEWEQQNQQHRHGVHRHSLASYSLDPAAVESLFGDYIRRFGACF